MAKLYQPIPGLPSPNDFADMFSVRKAPSKQGPVGNTYGSTMAGTAHTLQTLQRLKGEPVMSDEEALATVAANTRNAKSTLYPTAQGAASLRQYIAEAYPNGTAIPRQLAEALDAIEQGGMNDMGLATRMSQDQEQRKAAGTYDYGKRVGGLGGGATEESIRPTTYLEDVLNTPAEVARAQDMAALGPTGPGIFTPILSAALSFINPALGGIAASAFSGDRGPLSVLGAAGAALGGTDAYSRLYGAAKGAAGFDEGFSNPEALGLAGKAGELYQPASLGKVGSDPGTVRGFEGMSSRALYTPEALKGAWGAFDFAPQPGLEGLTPDKLYNPEALGGKPSKSPLDIIDGLDLLDFMPSGGGAEAEAPASPGMPATGGTSSNIYSPQVGGAVGPQTISPGFLGGLPDDVAQLLGNKPGVGHGTRAGAPGNVLRAAEPWNIYTP